MKIQKVLRTQWVLPVSGPGHLTPSQCLPPLTLLLYFLQIALGCECSDELGPCPSSHAAHRPCVPHIEIDLGSTSMSEGGFLVLLDDCIKFLCLRQGRKESTQGDHYCNCCVSAEKRTCSFYTHGLVCMHVCAHTYIHACVRACLCESVGTCVLWCMCGGQRVTLRSRFWFSLWIPGLGLGQSVCVASTFLYNLFSYYLVRDLTT